MAAVKPDDEIMRDVVSGDPDAFRFLVEKYTRRIFSVSYRYLNNYQDAEDVTQEVFTRGFAAAKKFKAYGSVYGWLLRIAVNLCINELKSTRRRVVGVLETGTEEGVNGEEDIRRQEMKRAIEEAMSHIPDSQRMAIILSKYEGLSYKEIAEITGRSVSSVESLIVRARRALVKKLEKYIVTS